MKVRFPLYAKILGWFFLNLVFLGLVSYVFFKTQFRLGLDSLLMGRAGEHIEALSEVIAGEIKQTPRGQWDEVLKRFSEAYRVRFYLFRDDGPQAAGDAVALPTPVLKRLTEVGSPPPERGPRRGEMRGSQPNEIGLPQRPGGPDGPPPEFGPEGGPPGRPRGEPPLPVGPRSRFMLHTPDPGRYWVLIRTGVMDFGPPRPIPLTLIAMSSSIRGGGLFFDFVPWAWIGTGVLFFSVLFWFPLVRGITRSISQMSQATEAIAEGRFDAPMQSDRWDELGRLSQAIHRMAARLSGFVYGQKRFLGDIAHELCSPIARMQVALGILEERADAKQKAYVEDVREEVQHMSSLVNELLSFSKAGLRQKEIKLESVNLEALARRVVNREAPGANPIELQIDPALHALAEPELLARALANLVRNAMRYAGEAGPITLSASRNEGNVAITVSDHGPGVPDGVLGQIFDPFFRVEASRSRDTGGIGLGLSIVKTCIEACQGTVTARNRQPNGLEVEILLQSCGESPCDR